MGISSHEDLKVWQKAMDLVEEVYRQVKKLPEEERFELSSQMRRAAVSIPSNIAEGHSRGSRKDYVNFLIIARGSNAEIHTQMLIAVRLGYLSKAEIGRFLALYDEVGRMLNGLITSLNAKS